jgi:hypothetical protein
MTSPAPDPVPTWQHYRARVAALTRDRAPDDVELLQARLDLALMRAEHDAATHAATIADLRARVAAARRRATSTRHAPAPAATPTPTGA